jgi:hypothetical protein
MSTDTRDTPPIADADARAVADALAAGQSVDPAVARRVRERSDRARRATEARLGVQDIGGRIIREMRDGG